MTVNTSVESKHLKGRRYEIKCDKKHRPAQIHKDTCVSTFFDDDGVPEVNDDNVGDFCLYYILEDHRRELEELFAPGNPDGSELTLNAMIGYAIEWAKSVQGAGSGGRLPGGMADLASFVKDVGEPIPGGPKETVL